MKHRLCVHIGKRTEIIFCADGSSILDALAAHGIDVPAPCGGNGTCGKCEIEVRGALLPPYDDDVKKRLPACRAFPCGDVSVWLTAVPVPKPCRISHKTVCDGSALGVAFDVGTTGISAVLCDMKSGERLGTLCEKNAQSAFGADIITRIGHASGYEDKRRKLTALLREQLDSMLTTLHREKSQISYITIAANTAISHFVAALPLNGLAAAPYAPADLFGREYSAQELSLNCKNARVFILPAFGAFVGGDISSGILATGLHKKRKLSLLIDIGTNGEMALGSSAGIRCASAAAGPAFEGAGLSCGMAAESGAICSFDLNNYKTIGGARARGICGSGIIDIAAVLLRCGVIDGGGRLLPPDEAPTLSDRLSVRGGEVVFTVCRDVFVTASDIRALQLAKAAIRAGIHALTADAAVSEADIQYVFPAGAFGSHIKKENAAAIGLIPQSMLLKCTPCGNSSLEGAVMALLSSHCRSELSIIRKKSSVCELSGSEVFNEAFLEYMHM